MRRVTRSSVRDWVHGERGAAASLLAVLLAGGVIMGMLAISVDIGNIMYERRQVQNAADATSLALASECAADKDKCLPGEVDDLLNANSDDGLSRWGDKYAVDTSQTGVCARGDSSTVGSLLDVVECLDDGSVEQLSACPPLPSWLPYDSGIPYVETYAATQTGSGKALFLPFSKLLVGGEADDVGVTACARTAWGQPAGFDGSLPLTFSACEWKKQVEDGPGYVSDPPVGSSETDPGYGGPGQPAWPTDPDKEVVIMLHDPNDEDSDCDWHSGMDTSGGFGWLESDGNCEAVIYPDDWVHIDTGADIPSGCGEKLPELRHTVVDIPIFDCILGSQPSTPPTGPPPTDPDGEETCDPESGDAGGNKSWYHLAGWAKFYISGYKLTGTPNVGSSSMPGGKSCSGGERCLIGWFMTGALADDHDIAPPGGDDFGAYIIKPAG